MSFLNSFNTALTAAFERIMGKITKTQLRLGIISRASQLRDEGISGQEMDFLMEPEFSLSSQVKNSVGSRRIEGKQDDGVTPQSKEEGVSVSRKTVII